MDEKLDPREEEMRRFQRVVDQTIAAERRAREEAEAALAAYLRREKAETGETRRRYLRPLALPAALAAGAWQWACRGPAQATLTGAAAASVVWLGAPGPGESRPQEPAAQPPPSVKAPRLSATPSASPASSAPRHPMTPSTQTREPVGDTESRPGAVDTGAAGETTDGADPRVAPPTIAAPADTPDEATRGPRVPVSRGLSHDRAGKPDASPSPTPTCASPLPGDMALPMCLNDSPG